MSSNVELTEAEFEQLRRDAEYEANRFPNDDWPPIVLALIAHIAEVTARADAAEASEEDAWSRLHLAEDYVDALTFTGGVFKARLMREILQPEAGTAPPSVVVLTEVAAERRRQDARWGEQNHPDGTGPTMARLNAADFARRECDYAAKHGRVTYRHILEEEVAEAFAEANPERLRDELIQVAAVAAAWVEKLDRAALAGEQ